MGVAAPFHLPVTCADEAGASRNDADPSAVVLTSGGNATISFTEAEPLETVRIVQAQELGIRCVTVGINLPPCARQRVASLCAAIYALPDPPGAPAPIQLGTPPVFSYRAAE